MQVVLAAILLSGLGSALAQEDALPDGPPEPAEFPAELPPELPPELTPEDRLAAAIQAYLSGELESARRAFLALVADAGLEQSHPQVRREAQVYLGSLDYDRGDRDAARSTFLSILLEEPDFELDPFAHPPELLAFFDSVRVQAQVMRPPPPATVEPRPRLNPLLLVVPGGLQLYNEQRGYGLSVLGGVAALALTTGALNLRLRAMDKDSGASGVQVYTEADKQLAEQLKLLNNVAGWSTVGLWSLTFLHGALVSTRRDGTERVSVVGPNLWVRW